jgi:hypothetical protein
VNTRTTLTTPVIISSFSSFISFKERGYNVAWIRKSPKKIQSSSILCSGIKNTAFRKFLCTFETLNMVYCSFTYVHESIISLTDFPRVDMEDIRIYWSSFNRFRLKLPFY